MRKHAFFHMVNFAAAQRRARISHPKRPCRHAETHARSRQALAPTYDRAVVTTGKEPHVELTCAFRLLTALSQGRPGLGTDQPFAVAGIAWDGSVTNRPGARFGPRAIREASHMLCDGIAPALRRHAAGPLGRRRRPGAAQHQL
jgi:hypothetical protein